MNKHCIPAFYVSICCHFLLFMAFFCRIQAQTHGTDSLKRVLAAAENDSLRCATLTLLAETAPDGEWEVFNNRLGNCSREAFRVAGRLNLKKFYARAFGLSLNNQGLIWQRLNEAGKEVSCYLAANRIFKAISDTGCMATSLSNIGVCYLIRHMTDSALACFKSSHDLSLAVNDRSGLANSLMNIGNVHYRRNAMQTALVFYEKSLKLSVELKDDWQTALTLRKIGNIYSDLFEYGKAGEYFKKAMLLCSGTGDLLGYSETLAAVSVIAINLKHYEEAEKGLKECLAINGRYDFVSRNADLLLHLGEIYLIQHRKTDTVLSYFSAALRLLSDRDSERAGTIASRLARLYKEKGDLSAARNYGEKALHIAQNFGNADMAIAAAAVLQPIYTTNGDYKKALHVANLVNLLSDSIFNAKNRLAAIRSQYRSDYLMRSVADSLKILHEKENYEYRINTEKRRRYMIVLCSVILLLLLLLLIQKMWHRQKLKVAALRNDIASDLHDEIGASIASIRLTAGSAARSPDQRQREDSFKNIEETSLEIAKSMSDIIWSVKPGNDRVLLLLDKMQRSGQELCRHTDTEFVFRRGHISGDPLLSPSERRHVYLIYREALHNCVKHAGATEIDVRVSFDNRLLQLEVQDNGRGFDETNIMAGNGLNNMRQRAAALGATLDVESVAGSYTRVTLECRTGHRNVA